MPTLTNASDQVRGSTASIGGIRLARFTSDTGPLTKKFSLSEDGSLIKQTAAMLSLGRVDNLTLDSFNAFPDVLMALAPNQALAYGVSLRGDGSIMSEKRWTKRGRPEAVLLRNGDHFDWPTGSGILMLDIDPPKEGEPLTREDLLRVLYQVLPELEKAAHFWWPSTSSCIYNTATDKEVTGIRGQRVYVWVADASDIPRVGEILENRLWLAGYGRFDYSISGSKLARTPVDGAVWQPERLDFAAGAQCEAPLVQRRPSPVRYGGDAPLDTQALPDISEAEIQRIEKLKAVAWALVKDAADKAKEIWILARGREIQTTCDLDEKSACKVAREAVEHQRLRGDFVLVSHEGTRVSVAQILDQPDVWNAERFHDPLDPGYPDDRIATVNLYSGGRPYLWSHAHGGCRYELCRTVATVNILGGGTALATDETLNLMRQDGGYYERGNAVVTVTERGEVQLLGPYALKQKVERGISFQRWDERKKDMKSVDCPDEIARRVLDMRGASGLPLLGGIVQYPTMTATGRLLGKPGYDHETRLLLLNPQGKPWPGVPERPSEEQVLAALARLWEPFCKFPFVDDTSRGIVLSAILTAVVRRCLPTAPAFMFAAPAAGSGKTLLGASIVALVGGASAVSLPDADAEVAKLLISVLRKGAGAVFFDNVVGTVDSKVLNAVLTSPEFDGRILGLSEMTGPLPTNALVVLTGNNARPGGDTCRRMLVCTIDPKEEAPYKREFAFNPLYQIRANKMQLVVAALTILRGWSTSGIERVARGNLASFEEWDRLIRQAVVWTGQLERKVRGQNAIGYGDPTAGINGLYAEDDESEALDALLKAMASAQDGTGFKAAELFGFLDATRAERGVAGPDLALLGHALVEVMPKAQTSKGVSKWLKSVRGRIIDGLRLEGRHDKAANNTTWYVQRV